MFDQYRKTALRSTRCAQRHFFLAAHRRYQSSLKPRPYSSQLAASSHNRQRHSLTKEEVAQHSARLRVGAMSVQRNKGRHSPAGGVTRHLKSRRGGRKVSGGRQAAAEQWGASSVFVLPSWHGQPSSAGASGCGLR
jgi:hypothetical protein